MPDQPPKRKKRRMATIPDRYAAFMDGELTIDDLDDEEIMRGQLRNKQGDFRGGRPLMVPREFAQALAEKQREVFRREIAPMVLQALRTLDEVMARRNPMPGDSARVAAAKLVLEYNVGKVPDKVEMKAEIKHWEDVMGEVLVDVEEDDKELGQ